MLVQGIVFMCLTLLFDYIYNTTYKRQDNRQETVQRPQLEEGQDVVNHREFTKRIWDKNGDES